MAATPTAAGLDQLVREYLDTHPRSAQLHRTAREYFTARGATHFARARPVCRPYITHARGAMKWDVDGHEYVDYVMGHGSLLLGHGHPDVVRAVQEQAARGFHYGDNHALEVEWAGLIRRLMPAAERIEFCASGQEANALGFRLGRALTGRRKVLRIRANYSGWLDELAGPDQPGIVADGVEFAPMNDLDALEARLASREYAVLLVEGGGGFLAGRIPAPVSYYQALPALARQHGTILLLDEVVTGFREAPGGWQSVVGISPDLTSAGKAVSGGLPCGVLLGRAEVFGSLDPDRHARPVSHGGTWNAVPLTAAAGIAACRLYLDGAPQGAALHAATRVKAGCNEALARRGVSGRVYGRSVLHLYFGPVDAPADADGPTRDLTKLLDPATYRASERLELHLLQRGIASLRGEAMILSAAHDDDAVARTIAAFDRSIAAMLEEGTLSA